MKNTIKHRGYTLVYFLERTIKGDIYFGHSLCNNKILNFSGSLNYVENEFKSSVDEQLLKVKNLNNEINKG